ncbi:MAG: glycosyltransferase family 4 protein [Nitrospirae bacterium]|nr:glycosyltransferase family 4 protein [Nitrospirota bacterium]
MRVLLLTRFARLGSSSRYRHYQYLPYLQKQGFEFTVAPLLDDDYIECIYSAQNASRLYLLVRYWQRVWILLRARQYDLIWLEKEIFPLLPAWLERWWAQRRIRYVVDYDDATFHMYDLHPLRIVRLLLGNKIDQVMRSAALVTAGNDYVADRARRAGASHVEVIPSVVDLVRYLPNYPPTNEVFTIGWIGSPVTTRHLLEIESALRNFCKDGNGRVVAIGASPVAMRQVPLKVELWSESTEVDQLRRFDVGIMPLPNSPWERGKSGLKLIQYMAVACPVIASPVGVNSDIVENGINGLVASDSGDWFSLLEFLKANRETSCKMGASGREKVERKYSLQIMAPQISRLFENLMQ